MPRLSPAEFFDEQLLRHASLLPEAAAALDAAEVAERGKDNPDAMPCLGGCGRSCAFPLCPHCQEAARHSHLYAGLRSFVGMHRQVQAGRNAQPKTVLKARAFLRDLRVLVAAQSRQGEGSE